MSESIQFSTEDIDFQLVGEEDIRFWISQIVQRNKFQVGQIDYVFCSDEFLLQLNKEHLDHDYYTDILTFPLHSNGSREIIGDIFISVPRIEENAKELGEAFIDEMHRVIIHGVLHLCGLEDQTPAESASMRKAEDLALSLRMF